MVNSCYIVSDLEQFPLKWGMIFLKVNFFTILHLIDVRKKEHKITKHNLFLPFPFRNHRFIKVFEAILCEKVL